MAEYIDKVQAMNIIAEGKNDKPYFGTTEKDWEVIDFLKTVPTADVVERDKIDKAIEEIMEYVKYCDENLQAPLISRAIYILKRNIGENK